MFTLQKIYPRIIAFWSFIGNSKSLFYLNKFFIITKQCQLHKSADNGDTKHYRIIKRNYTINRFGKLKMDLRRLVYLTINVLIYWACVRGRIIWKKAPSFSSAIAKISPLWFSMIFWALKIELKYRVFVI